MTTLPFPSEDVVAAAADAVMNVLTPHLSGKNRLRRKMLAMSVARTALTTAWFRPHKGPEPTNPYQRWCASCREVVAAHYTAHPNMPNCNAMLCPHCGSVSRPIIRQ